MATEIPHDWDDTAGEPEPPVVSPTDDGLDVREDRAAVDEEELDVTIVTAPLDAPDADLDNVIVEFVDLVNARDLDSLSELLAPDVDADFLGTGAREHVVEALHDLTLRQPDLVVTRGDRGTTPLVAAWLLDADADEYRFAGVFEIELADDEPLIGRLVYIEEPPVDDLVLELPDVSERPEWEDWAAQDET
ncbi:MAG TPA: nuclear transport factor 2 family protein [Acidimicrobiia bacterium]|nr:nuclear transport factor 2 family protein [Acidimicrobiia bacterium]